jgi:hypothetical protein
MERMIREAMLVKQMLRPESGGRICEDVIYYVNWGGYGCSCLIEMNILPLNPLFIRFLYPSQIHYSEVESTVSCKLLVRNHYCRKHTTYFGVLTFPTTMCVTSDRKSALKIAPIC